MMDNDFYQHNRTKTRLEELKEWEAIERDMDDTKHRLIKFCIYASTLAIIVWAWVCVAG